MQTKPSGNVPPTHPVTGPVSPNQNGAQPQPVNATPVTPPRMVIPAATEENSPIATPRPRLNIALPALKKFKAKMGKIFGKKSTRSVAIAQPVQASLPASFSLNQITTSHKHSKLPEWMLAHSDLNIVHYANADGTYDLKVDTGYFQSIQKIGKIADVLRHSTCIRKFVLEIDLTYILDYMPGHGDLCNALRRNSSLQTFVLDIDWSPYLPAPQQIFEFCKAAHEHPTLKSVEIFPYHSLDCDAYLNEELSDPRSKLTAVTTLVPNNSNSVDAFIMALARNRQLTELTLVFHSDRGERNTFLAEALKNHRALNSLHLVFACRIPDSEQLFHILAASPSLRYLSVKASDGAYAAGLKAFLSASTSVRHIELEFEKLRAREAADLAAGFDMNQSIVEAEFTLEDTGNVEEKTRIDRAIELARSRNRQQLLDKMAKRTGDAFFAALEGSQAAMAGSRLPVLPPEIGEKIAGFVAGNPIFNEALKDARNFLNAVRQPAPPTRETTADQARITSTTANQADATKPSN